MRHMTLAEKLEKLIAERGWKQADLARAIDMGRSTVGNWFNSPSKPDLDSALKLARVLAVPLDYLADDAQDDPPPGPDPALERLLWLVSTIGVEESIRRLTQAPESRPPAGQSYAEEKAAKQRLDAMSRDPGNKAG